MLKGSGVAGHLVLLVHQTDTEMQKHAWPLKDLKGGA